MIPMPGRRRALIAFVCALWAGGASAQIERPVKMLVGFAAGGSADIAARLLAERMQGADFAPVARVADFQFALSVNAANPSRTVADLITWARFNASLANYGTPAPGSLPHFFGVQIAKATGIDFVHVPFNGGAPAMNALIGNQVGFVIDTVVAGIEMHRAGKSRILATSGTAHSPLLPGVPTFREARLADVEGVSWFAIYAPAKTPEPVVRQLNAAINKALAAPELRERFVRLGLEPTGGAPADLAVAMKRDTERWEPVVRASGFRAE
jgi:tripartite-type tricarboxylate transporter receptor subunit TctC